MSTLNQNYCVIMAGGIGSRFWPWSTTEHPKQFLDILGTGESLLQLTFKRFLNLCPAENIFIVSNSAYIDLIQKQLPEIPVSNILLEPIRRNTAPCIAYASYRIKKANPKAQIVVTPADHLIENETVFIENIRTGLSAVKAKNSIVTLGVHPTRPDTGYGYIQCGKKTENDTFEVSRFTEKPEAKLAEQYLASGEYLWNSGIFIWSAQTICQELQDHIPEISSAFEKEFESLGTPNEQPMIERIFPQLPDISVDYGIMEKANHVELVEGKFDWSDLGTWGSLYEHLNKDAQQNAKFGLKPVLENSANNIIKVPEGKKVIIEGLENYIVVDTEDALLICSKDSEQQIKQLVDKLDQ